MASTDENTADWFGFAWLSDDFVPPPVEDKEEKGPNVREKTAEKEIRKAPKVDKVTGENATSALCNETNSLSCSNKVSGAIELSLSKKTLDSAEGNLSVRSNILEKKEVEKIGSKLSSSKFSPPPTPANLSKVSPLKRGDASSTVSCSPFKTIAADCSPISKCSVVLKKNPILDKLPRQNSLENVFAFVNDKIKIKNDSSVEDIPERKRKLSSSESDSSVASLGVKRQNSSEKKPDTMVFNANIQVRKSGRLKSAKCSSRYRGDYGIRAEVFTKLACKKADENEAVVLKETHDGTDDEALKTPTNKCVESPNKMGVSKPETDSYKIKETTNEEVKSETAVIVKASKSTALLLIEGDNDSICKHDSDNCIQKLTNIEAKADQTEKLTNQSETVAIKPYRCDEKRYMKIDPTGGSKKCNQKLIDTKANDKVTDEEGQKVNQAKSDFNIGSKKAAQKVDDTKSDVNVGIKVDVQKAGDMNFSITSAKKDDIQKGSETNSEYTIGGKKDTKRETKKITLKQVKNKPVKRKVGPILRTHMALQTTVKKDKCYEQEFPQKECVDTNIDSGTDKYIQMKASKRKNTSDTKSEEMGIISNSSVLSETKSGGVDKSDIIQSVTNIKELGSTGISKSNESRKQIGTISVCENNQINNVCDRLPNVPSIETVNNQLHSTELIKPENSVLVSNTSKPQSFDGSVCNDIKSVKTDESMRTPNYPVNVLAGTPVVDNSDRKSNTSNYVHSISKLVSKQKERKEPQSGTEIKVNENSPSGDISDQLLAEDDSSSVLENLRLRLFASAGIKPVEVVDKPKNFESKIKQPKGNKSSSFFKNSSQESKSHYNNANSVKSVSKAVIETVSNKSNSFSSRSSNISDHSSRCSTPNSEILEEVSKKLEVLQKAKHKEDCSQVQKLKRPRFEHKKFMLRSMIQTKAESDSESHSSVSTGNSDESVKDDLNRNKQTKYTTKAESKKDSKQLSAATKDVGIVESVAKIRESKDVETKRTKQHERKQQLAKPKPVKCHACGHIFKNKELLRKHYPCRMRQTRTWSQNKLRPNRVFRRVEAPPKEQGRKRFICLLPKSKKHGDKTRPHLLTYRKTKFRRVKGKRRRKLHMILQELIERRKPKSYPHLCVNYDEMTPKSQFFYKLGLFCPVSSCNSGVKDYFSPTAGMFVQRSDYEHDKENRSANLKSGQNHEKEQNHERMQWQHRDSGMSVVMGTESIQEIKTYPNITTELSLMKVVQSSNCQNTNKQRESPPVLEKIDGDGECLELFDFYSEKELVIDKRSSEPPILELQFESPKKMQKERHFLDFVEKSEDLTSFNPSNTSIVKLDDQSTNDVKNTMSLKSFAEFKNTHKKGNSLLSSPMKGMIERHFTDIIGVSDVKSPVMEKNTMKNVLNDNILWEQSERGEMTLAEIREILKPKSRNENAFSKESLLKLRSDLAKLLTKVKTPVKDDAGLSVKIPKPASGALAITHPDFDFSMYERKSLFETLENVESNNLERRTSCEDTGYSCSESDLSTTESDHSDLYKSSLDYEQDLLPPTKMEGDSMDSTTKGCITDNILQMLSTLEDKGSVAENMSNLLQILAENLGITNSSQQEKEHLASVENENMEMLGEIHKISEMKQTIETEDDNFETQESASLYPVETGSSVLQERILETGPNVSHLSNTDNKLSSDMLRNNLATVSEAHVIGGSESELVLAQSVPGGQLPAGENCTDTEVNKETEKSADILKDSVVGIVVCSEPSGQNIDVQGQIEEENKAKSLKESALFKSITELSSIETDSDSNHGDSYDAYTMSKKLAELKATNCDGSASDVNSDALSDYKENDNMSDSDASEKSRETDTEKSSVFSSTDQENKIMENRPVINQSPTAYDSDVMSGDETEVLEERPRLIMKIKLPAGNSFNTVDESFHKDSSSYTSASSKSSDNSDIEEAGRDEEHTLTSVDAKQEEANKAEILEEESYIPARSEEVEEETSQNNSDIPVAMQSVLNSASAHEIKQDTERVSDINEISFPRKLKLKTGLTIGDSFDYESDTSSSFEKEVTIIPQVGTSPRAPEYSSDRLQSEKCASSEEKDIDFTAILKTNEISKGNQETKVNDSNQNIYLETVTDEIIKNDTVALMSDMNSENDNTQKSCTDEYEILLKSTYNATVQMDNFAEKQNLDIDIPLEKGDITKSEESISETKYFSCPVDKTINTGLPVSSDVHTELADKTKEVEIQRETYSDSAREVKYELNVDADLSSRDNNVELSCVNSTSMDKEEIGQIKNCNTADTQNITEGSVKDSLIAKSAVDLHSCTQNLLSHSFNLEHEMEPIEFMRNSPKNSFAVSSENISNRSDFGEIIEKDLADDRSDSSGNKISGTDDLSSSECNEISLDTPETMTEEFVDKSLFVEKETPFEEGNSANDIIGTEPSESVSAEKYGTLLETPENSVSSEQLLTDGKKTDMLFSASKGYIYDEQISKKSINENQTSCNDENYQDQVHVIPPDISQDKDEILSKKGSKQIDSVTSINTCEEKVKAKTNTSFEKMVHELSSSKTDINEESMETLTVTELTYDVGTNEICEKTDVKCQSEIVNEKVESEVKPVLKNSDNLEKNDTERKRKRISFSDYLSRIKKGKVPRKDNGSANSQTPADSSKIGYNSRILQTESDESFKPEAANLMDMINVEMKESSENTNMDNETKSISDKGENKASYMSEELFDQNLRTQKKDNSLTEFEIPDYFTKQQKSKRFVSMPLTKKSDIVSIENKALNTKATGTHSYSERERLNTNTEVPNKETEVAKSEDDVLSVFDSLFNLGETVLSLSKSEKNSDVDKSTHEDDGNLFSALDTLCKVGDVINLRKSTDGNKMGEPSREPDVVEVIDLTEPALNDSFTDERESNCRTFFLELDEWLKESLDTGSMNNMNDTQCQNIYTPPDDCLSELNNFSGVHLNRFRYNLYAFEEEYFEIRLKDDETGVDNTLDVIENESLQDGNTVQNEASSGTTGHMPCTEVFPAGQENSDLSECYNEDFDDMLAAQMAINEEAMSQKVPEDSASLESEISENVGKQLHYESSQNKEIHSQHSLVSMEYDDISEESISDEETRLKKLLKRKHKETNSEKSDHKRKKYTEKYKEPFDSEKIKYSKTLKETKRSEKEYQNIENRERSMNKSNRSHFSYEGKPRHSAVAEGKPRHSTVAESKSDRSKLFLAEKFNLNSS